MVKMDTGGKPLISRSINEVKKGAYTPGIHGSRRGNRSHQNTAVRYAAEHTFQFYKMQCKRHNNKTDETNNQCNPKLIKILSSKHDRYMELKCIGGKLFHENRDSIA